MDDKFDIVLANYMKHDLTGKLVLFLEGISIIVSFPS